MKAQELFEKVTAEMIQAIEAGAGEWRMPWHTLAGAGTPENVDGRAYRGMNALLLPMVASARGWDSGLWATYRGWQRHGAQVRRGAKGTTVVLWKQTTPRSDRTGPGGSDAADDDGTDAGAGAAEGRPTRRSRRPGWFARAFTVFAAEQVDGAEEILSARRAPTVSRPAPERRAWAETYFGALGATVTEWGDRAYYRPTTDSITVPPLAQFHDTEHYYSVLAHEHVHWTGHPSRCDRDLSGRFGSQAYAAEELVAELGAAMWSAQSGIAQATRQDHAAYLAHWLEILRADARHLATVATRAQTAIDWMNTRAGPAPPSDVTGVAGTG